FMERKTKLAIIGSVAALIIIAIALVSMIIEKLTPSTEIMELTDYYKLKDSEVLVILQNEVYEKKGLLINDRVYIDYETVAQKFNKRFYWDSNENILTYTTPTQILKAEADSSEYSVTKSTIATKTAADYPIVKVFADQVYVALDFVKEYSDLTYEYYKNPNRIIVNYIWGDYLYSDVSKATQLRYEASIKSPILLELPVGTSLMYVDTEEAPKNGFVKVMTTDGIKGYIKKKNLKKSYYQKLESSYQAPEYTAQTRSGKINMVFHNVTYEYAAGDLESLINDTKKVNVISPTWFSINDVSGTISSIATEDYVNKAGDLGLEVWALVNDFNADISMRDLLSYTSRRETLSNALIEAALTYKLNGINIDFEKIPSDAGEDYIQFLRELSVKCRNNGIVLSVDSYVPTEYTAYYDREEQGKIVDYVVVMAYDEYYGGSEVAGPVASISFVKDAVTNILTMVPKEKTIIAIPFYTRLWKETEAGEVSSEGYAMTKAKELIEDNNLEAKWDDTYGCYYVEYQQDGATYRMWQEEEKSIEEKMKVIYDADVAGSAAWKLGQESESIWDVIERYLN
ncbi:MAG: glycosyl hydrolase family 18 protein, partial [Herbinix sp.]|nr:glycosyl hydrolase family 18 protein [Herbinix sp.]